jgi:hypothetical protein
MTQKKSFLHYCNHHLEQILSSPGSSGTLLGEKQSRFWKIKTYMSSHGEKKIIKGKKKPPVHNHKLSISAALTLRTTTRKKGPSIN